MKHIIFTLVIVLLLGSIVKTSDLYGRYAVVVDIIDDAVVFEDSQGFLWENDGVEDWQIGDGATLIMARNYTPEIFDDKILTISYVG